MNREDKPQPGNPLIGKLFQYEEIYAQMAFQCNKMLNEKLSTKDLQQAAFKVNAILSSCVNEEEKIAQSLIKQLDEEISAQAKPRKETRKQKTTSKRELVLFQFPISYDSSDALLDISKITVGSVAVAFINGNWIIVRVNDIRDGIYPLIIVYEFLTCTFTVVDGEENLEHPQQYMVLASDIIHYPLSFIQAHYSTRDYVLPPGTRVLALWPGSTAFYDAVVLPRTNIPQNCMLVQFEGAEPQQVYYRDVIPYKHSGYLVCFIKWIV